MSFIIVSPRVGTPGEIYDPPVWVNTQALLDAGFIVPTSKKPAPDKPAKAKVSKKAAPDATSAQE